MSASKAHTQLKESVTSWRQYVMNTTLKINWTTLLVTMLLTCKKHSLCASPVNKRMTMTEIVLRTLSSGGTSPWKIIKQQMLLWQRNSACSVERTNVVSPSLSKLSKLSSNSICGKERLLCCSQHKKTQHGGK